MQTSKTLDWGRVVTPLRWIARVLAVVMAGFLGYWAISATMAYEASADLVWNYVTFGVTAIGFVLAIFWSGIGEVVGGLALVVGAAGYAFFMVTPFTVVVPLALIGALFIACGWYTLAQSRSRGTAHATA